MKVLFFTPIFNFQDPKIRKNHEYIRSLSNHQVAYAEVIGASVEHAKSIMYKEFLAGDFDYFFNVDADIMFMNPDINPIDTLVKLAEQSKGLVGGIYVYKRIPALPAFRPLDLQKIYEEKGEFPKDYKFNIPTEPFEVEWLPGGCMMISKAILQKVYEQISVPNLPMIHKKEYLSEDFAFCHRVRDNNFIVVADPRIELGHAGTYLFTIKEDYQK